MVYEVKLLVWNPLHCKCIGMYCLWICPRLYVVHDSNLLFLYLDASLCVSVAPYWCTHYSYISLVCKNKIKRIKLQVKLPFTAPGTCYFISSMPAPFLCKCDKLLDHRHAAYCKFPCKLNAWNQKKVWVTAPCNQRAMPPVPVLSRALCSYHKFVIGTSKSACKSAIRSTITSGYQITVIPVARPSKARRNCGTRKTKNDTHVFTLCGPGLLCEW